MLASKHYGSYLLCLALLPVLLFYFLRPTAGGRAAFGAGLLLVLSPVAYTAFWYVLYKNAFALDLILGAFILIERRSRWWLFAFDAAIALSHETSAVIYLATLGVLFLTSKGWRWQAAAHAGLTLALFLSVNFSLIHQATVALPTALFVEWPEYLQLSAPFLLLVVCALPLWWHRRLRLPRTLAAFAIAAFAFPLLHLPFYERIFVFCDVALAAYAGCAAAWLVAQVRTQGSPRAYAPLAALLAAAGLLAGTWFNQLGALAPLMTPGDTGAIRAVGALLPPGAYVLTTADEAPWYEGWTQAHVIAPGLLHDTHNLEEWTAVWDATSTAPVINLLHSFPQPLYVSTLGSLSDLLGQVPDCVVQVSENLWQNGC